MGSALQWFVCSLNCRREALDSQEGNAVPFLCTAMRVFTCELTKRVIVSLVCRPEALGAQEGDTIVPALDIGKEGCHGCTRLDSANYIGETVKMLTVDGLNLPKVRLIKVSFP